MRYLIPLAFVALVALLLSVLAGCVPKSTPPERLVVDQQFTEVPAIVRVPCIDEDQRPPRRAYGDEDLSWLNPDNPVDGERGARLLGAARGWRQNDLDKFYEITEPCLTVDGN